MADLTLDAARATLRATFGYDDFRPGQASAVESVLAGRDTMVILPTGGGKSLCFQVPALLLDGLTVVISPLISLMKDQVDTLSARNVPAAFINSTLTSAQVSDRMARAARGEIKLLYVAPERFDVGTSAQQLRKIGVSLLAIDEAHCISQWGHDFRPSYLRVRAVREALGDPPTVALTATATPQVREDIAYQLALRDPKVIITGFDRKNLTYYVLPARNDADKDALLLDTLRKYEGLAVVYATTRKAVERITHFLTRHGIAAAGYHAGLDDEHRHEVQDDFMRERVRVIVATNAFGMGIDKPNVRLVIHHAMPGTLEAYYQEAGRAGRDGEHSDVFLLHAFQDRFTHEYFIKGAYPERSLIEAVYTTLQRRADPRGVVTHTYDQIAAALSVKANTRDVESALRVLEQGGAIGKESESFTKVHIRLLATPDRIKRELGGDANLEIELLRSLWRITGNPLYEGVTVDLQSLPFSLGTPPEVTALLDDLQSRQFLVYSRLGGGISLTAPSRPITHFNIDWPLLDRRRAAELNKLQAVQQYAYTKFCRRIFVLRYFGDPAARALGEHCNGCDNCLGVAMARPNTSDKDASRTSKSERIKKPKRAKLADVKIDHSEELTEEAQPVFHALRMLRTEIAKEEQVAPFIVFGNKTLYNLAVHRPRSLKALEDIHGVGPVKIQKYGPRVIAAIADATARLGD